MIIGDADYSRKDYYSETISAETVGQEFVAKSEDGGTVYLTTDGRRITQTELDKMNAELRRKGHRVTIYEGHRDIRKKARQQAAREVARAEGEATNADVARMVNAARKRQIKAEKRAKLAKS